MTEIREDVAHLLRQGNCSLPEAVEVIGERWCFMILRAGLNGICHFEDFLNAIGIARNILANRLARLVDAGIMTRTPCEDDKRKVEYRLTEKGLDLLPTMLALRQWGEKWQTCMPSNPMLCDARDRQPIAPLRITAQDGRELEIEDLCWLDRSEVGQPPRDVAAASIRNLRDISAHS